MPIKAHKKNQEKTTIFTSAPVCLPKDSEALTILQKRAEKIAQIEIKKGQEKNIYSYIHFCLNKNEHYGIPYQLTKEVIQNTSITPIPSTFEFIAGIINRRGMLINVIDLKHFFGIKKSEKKINKNVIVVQNESMQVGLLVDSIEGSHHYSMDKLNPPIPSNNAIKLNYIIGLHNGTTAIINIDAILTEIETQLIK